MVLPHGLTVLNAELIGSKRGSTGNTEQLGKQGTLLGEIVTGR